MDALASDAATRDPARFVTLLAGRTSVNPVYDGWRRALALVRGTPLRIRPRFRTGSTMIVLALIVLALAAIPTVMTFVNVVALKVPEPAPLGTRVAILIPARDEEAGIAACIDRALASTGVALEVVVLDDGSTDATAAIVARMAEADPRLRLALAPPLPAGWTGKQHACHVLSSLSTAPHLLFIDADVGLAPDAASRLAGALAERGPRQRRAAPADGELRRTADHPDDQHAAAGLPADPARPRRPAPVAWGRLRTDDRRARRRLRHRRRTCGAAHEPSRRAVPAALVPGGQGLRTDLVAGARLASCRMYDGWRTVVRGTTKNATEALARPIALPIWTALLLGGRVAPWLLLAAAWTTDDPRLTAIVAAACAGPMIARLVQAIACREPLTSVPLDPFSVIALLTLQWLALGRKWAGRSETWRGRSYTAEG